MQGQGEHENTQESGDPKPDIILLSGNPDSAGAWDRTPCPPTAWFTAPSSPIRRRDNVRAAVFSNGTAIGTSEMHGR